MVYSLMFCKLNCCSLLALAANVFYYKLPKLENFWSASNDYSIWGGMWKGHTLLEKVTFSAAAARCSSGSSSRSK